MKSLILVESSQIPEELITQINSSCTVVAMSIPALKALEKAGINASLPDELIEIPDFDSSGTHNLSFAEKLADLLDKELEQLPEFNDLQVLKNYSFYLKVYLDNLLADYHVLKALLEHTGAQNAYIYAPRRELAKGPGGVPSCLAQVGYAFESRTVLQVIHSGAEKPPVLSLRKKFRSLFNRLRNGLFRLRSARVYKKTINALRSDHTSIVLLNRPSHDVADVPGLDLPGLKFAELIEHDGMLQLVLDGQTCLATKASKSDYKLIKATIQTFWKSQSYQTLQSEHANCIGLLDLQFWSVYEQGLTEYLSTHLSQAIGYRNKIEDAVDVMQPAFALMPDFRGSLLDSLILAVLHEKNIRRIAYQEGGGAGFLDWPFFDRDCKLADAFLSYGKGFQVESRTQVTGSLRLSLLAPALQKRANKKNDPALLYLADSYKYDGWQHYPGNGGFFTQAFRHQEEIIGNLIKTGSRFAIKTIPSRRHLYEHWSNRVAILVEPLHACVDQFAGLVTDGFATILLEGLLTGLPMAILLDGKNVSLRERGRTLLEERASLALDSASQLACIQQLIQEVQEGKTYAPVSPFIKEFGNTENVSQKLSNYFNSIISDRAHSA